MGSVESNSFTYDYFEKNLRKENKDYFILDDEKNKYLFTLVKENPTSLRISMERLEHSVPGSTISFKLPEHCDCKTDIHRENPHYTFSVYKSKEGLYKAEMNNIDRMLLKFFNELDKDFRTEKE